MNAAARLRLGEPADLGAELVGRHAERKLVQPKLDAELARDALFLFQKIERCRIVTHERRAEELLRLRLCAQALNNILRNDFSVDDHVCFMMLTSRVIYYPGLPTDIAIQDCDTVSTLP